MPNPGIDVRLRMIVPPPFPDPIGDILRADAVAYWKLEEASGTRVDATGKGHDFSDHGGVPSVSGKIGNAVQATAIGGAYLETPNTSDLTLNAGEDVTIAFWCKFPAIVDTAYFVAKIGGVGDTTEIFIYLNHADKKVYAVFWDDGVSSSASFPNDGAWHFVEARFKYAQTERGIAIDHSAFATITFALALIDHTGNFQLGANLGTTGDVDVNVDELGYWKRVLTDSERTYLWNNGNGRTLFP